MQRIYIVPTLDALAVYAPEITAGIETILAEARERGNNHRSVAEVWEEIAEHVTIAPHARLFVALDDGVLVSWIAAKVYVDGKKRNGCITWAWAAPTSRLSRDMVRMAEAFFRERECPNAYLGRSFLQPSFTRLMRRYGYTLSSVVYEKHLDSEVTNVDSLRPPGGEVRADVTEWHGDPSAETGSIAADSANVRHAESSVCRSDGESAEHGDQRADAASTVEPPGNVAVNGGRGGTAGEPAEYPGGDTDVTGWVWGDIFVIPPGCEPGGTADPGADGSA
jgi:hypothetical protein